jgi:hypothetical protein
MASSAPLPDWETFLPLWSSGALMTVEVAEGEELAVSVAAGDSDGDGDGLEAGAAAAGGVAAVAAGWAVEAVG